MSKSLSAGCRQLHIPGSAMLPQRLRMAAGKAFYAHEILLHLGAGDGALLVQWVAESSGRCGIRPALCCPAGALHA